MIEFEHKIELEIALSQQIASDLTLAIQHKGKATLLLSGGSTPSGVYRLLSEVDLDWSKVHVGLVDERFVNHASPYSNYKLILETLVQNKAKNTHVYSMVLDADNYLKNLEKVEPSYRIFTDPDVVLLGMGPDGHTASLFPNDPASAAANLNSNTLLSNTNAPAEPMQRISFNGPALRNAKSLYLMITGTQKKEIITQSKQLQLPIASFLEAISQTYFCSAS